MQISCLIYIKIIITFLTRLKGAKNWIRTSDSNLECLCTNRCTILAIFKHFAVWVFKHHMGFEPTPSAWRAEILAIIRMVHFKLITWREMHTPFWSLCSILPIPDNYLSRYQYKINGFRKLITASKSGQNFLKSYHKCKHLLHSKTYPFSFPDYWFNLSTQFSVRLWTLLNFTSAASIKPEKNNLKHIHKSIKLVLVTTCSYYNGYPTISRTIIRGTLSPSLILELQIIPSLLCKDFSIIATSLDCFNLILQVLLAITQFT